MHARTVLLFTLSLAVVGRAQIITAVAGSSSGTSGSEGDGGPATSALLQQPTGVALDGAGNIYIADYSNQRIRKVDKSGIITTIAGDGTAGETGDGGAANVAQVNYPWAIAVGGGNVYFTERLGHRVRKVDKAGIITTIAGNGTTVSSLDGAALGDGGPAKNASLYSPSGIAVDSAGNLYIGDTQHSRVRKVNTAGVITTFAGNGTSSTIVDGIAATSASLPLPYGVALDGVGNLYVASGGRIRKVNSDGIISTVAGNGSSTFSGDGGAATNAGLSPHGVDVDNAGNILVADTDNNRIRRVDTGGIITTIAGGNNGGIGDGGPAINAGIGTPQDVTVDAAGNVYIADTSHNSIRKIAAPGAVPVVNSAINGASFSSSPGFTNGALGSLFGTHFAPSNAQASTIPLPVSLNGVSVTIAGVPAPLLFVSSTQINLQVPWTLQFGPANVVVTVHGTASASFQTTISSLSAAIFTTQSGVGQAVAINPDGSLAGPAGSIPGSTLRPARAGETVVIYGTGLGLVSPSIATGAASTDALRRTIIKTTVLMGGKAAEVSFAGLSPQFVGVYQINAVVPSGVSGTVPLQIEQIGVRSSDKVTIAIAKP